MVPPDWPAPAAKLAKVWRELARVLRLVEDLRQASADLSHAMAEVLPRK